MWYRKQTLLIGLISLLLNCSIYASEPGAHSSEDTDTIPALNTLAVKAPQRLLMDIKRVEKGRLIAVGERGHIILSDDNGDNWRQIRVPTKALLTRLYFVNDRIGWAVGHQQVILKTEDAGETWVLQNRSDNLEQPALFDIWFGDLSRGIAVGSYGLFLTTSDGGSTWEEVYQESLEDEEIGFTHFYSLAFEKKSGKLFMAGELGFLAVSTDLGESWQQLESPYEGSFFRVAALPGGELLLMGLRGHLFRSKDVGVTWQEIDTGTISGLQNFLLMPETQKILIVGSDGTQLVSDDNGKTVKLMQRNDRVHLAGAVSTKDQKVLLVGIKGVIRAELF